MDDHLSDWQSIANELNLNFSGSPFYSINGVWEGHSVEIRSTKGQQGESTHFEISTKHAFNTSFHVTRQGVGQNLAELIGSRDIQIGNSAFDAAALIKGWNEELIRTLFSSENVRNHCLKILANDYYQNIEISQQRVAVSIRSIVTTKSGFITILRILLNATKALEQADRKHEPEPPAEVEQEIIPPVVVAVEKQVPTPKEVKKPEPVKKQAPILPHISAEQFSGLFDTEYRAKQIDWKCEVRHIVPDDSGWLATLELHELPGRGKCNLTAQYHIGQARKEDFDQQPGTKMRVQGNLVEFDTSSATLLIASGDQSEKSTTHSATILIQL